MSGIPAIFSHGPLRVADNRRHLVHEDGTYFLYLGDTAWELLHRLTREETERYLENRRAKGFTVIQTVVLGELDGIKTPNAYGHTPFINDDPRKPNEDYFAHVDWVLDRIASKGMYVGLLPTWGSHITNWNDDTSFFSVEDAEHYGRWLGNRCRARANIIWILGGDRPACGYGRPDRRAHWDAMARGIALGVCGSEDYDKLLMTYHPFGQHSSWPWFHDRTWLSFNMYQSGHYGHDDPAHFRMVEPNWKQIPPKPVLNGEACYEEMTVHFNAQNGYFDDFDVRQSAYWSVFAGSFGYVYGAHGIWQMYAPGRRPVSGARKYWYELLDYPGAMQMTHLRQLLLAHDPLSRMPDQSVLVRDYGESGRHLRACRGNGYVMVYTPYGAPIELKLDKLGAKALRAWWFCPRDGHSEIIGQVESGQGTRVFTPPEDEARGHDWVLVLQE